MARKRGRESARDMIYSMGAVLVAVLIILGITYRSHQQISQPVDFNSALKSAVTQSNWPILVPSNSPSNYRLSAARFEPESYGSQGQMRWYLGYQTSENQYVSLWQSDGPTDAIVTAASNNGECTAKVTVSGNEWTSCFQRKPVTRALYRTFDHQTVIVSGTLNQKQMETFASQLQPAK